MGEERELGWMLDSLGAPMSRFVSRGGDEYGGSYKGEVVCWW